MDTKTTQTMLENGGFDQSLSKIYTDVDAAKARYIKAIGEFEKLYGAKEIRLFTAPGRSEICGNHTDHNNGLAIASAVSLDTIAVVGLNSSRIVRIKSEGFPEDRVYIDEIGPRFNTSAGLIAGMIDGFEKRGAMLQGFDAYTTSNVPAGSGLSSSAAFENLVGVILNRMFCEDRVSVDELAKISKRAENDFFGKPCGLLDQLASASGDMVYVDFATGTFEKIGYNFDDLDLFIIKAEGDHSNLSSEYAAIKEEMQSVASAFGHKFLRDCNEKEVFDSLPQIVAKFGDRAFLRAVHYFNENKRVETAAKAIREGDKKKFLATVKESGYSSYMLLQNIYCSLSPTVQPLSTALAVCSQLLSDKEAAWRVHGGGFAGTVQAFVPKKYSAEFSAKVTELLGEGSAMNVSIRKVGVAEVCADSTK